LWIGGLAALVLTLDLMWQGKRHSTLGLISAIGLLPALPLLLWQKSLCTTELFGGLYRIDPTALFFKTIFIATAIIVVLITRELSNSFEQGHDSEITSGAASSSGSHGEFYLLILAATLGMLFTASAGNFLMLFVSLELITISFYVMTAYLKADSRSLEAGLKYLILGSIASGCFLYGIAYLYGATGSLQFSDIRAAIQQAPLSPGCFFGLLLILAGILFKTAVVPFHLWVPDVYEGAPTPVTAFLSVGSKSAGFLVALRVLIELFLPANAQWTWLLMWLAGLTILYGNLGAIPQTNIKRLFGYSSIGHAGYILIGIAAASSIGSTAVLFYLGGYLVTNLAAFLVIAAFSKQAGSDQMSDYAGLSRRSPFLAAVMFLSLLSLAGVPPLVGFFGKFLLLASAVSKGYLGLAIVGAAAVVISLYYYLVLVKTMYIDPPTDSTPVSVTLSVKIALAACAAGMLGIGICQSPFLQLSFSTIKTFF